PGSRPKCSQCHTRVIFGVRWNAYGQAVKKAINGDGIGNKPAAADIGRIEEYLRRIGKSEDFKADQKSGI
ncbi:MAG: hypothetical protein KGJ11_07545, partial [Candidatus Omnitrophica bacterium]|nr:hypothetical protein [Candidatus Omnitrophota bacterium]